MGHLSVLGTDVWLQKFFLRGYLLVPKPLWCHTPFNPSYTLRSVTMSGHVKYTHKTKGAFEGARGAIQAYGSLGSLKSSLSFVCDGHNGSTWSYTTHSMIGMRRMAAKGADLALSGSWTFYRQGAIWHIAQSWLGGATNGSPTLARLIMEQWLLLRIQYGSFTFICVQEGLFSM